MKRRDKDNYYLDIAETVLKRGTCIRRNYGAVIVKNDEIISTGYTGAPRGKINCCDINSCLRSEMEIPSGENYELCRSVHAEMNAIISTKRSSMIGSDMYLTGIDMNTGEYVKNAQPCIICRRLIINSGVEQVIIRDSMNDFRKIKVKEWIDGDDTLVYKEKK